MKIVLMPNLTRKEAFNVTTGICERLKELGAEYYFPSEYKKEFEFTGADFLPTEEAVAAETPAEEIPAEETPEKEAPAEETVAEEAPVAEIAVVEEA